MRAIQIVAGGWFVLATLASVACGSSSDGGGGGGAGASALHPPASIDLTVCASVTGGEFDSATLQACGTCCSNASFEAATIYANKCVCGHVMNDEDVCKTQPEAACGPCCTSASYSGSSFVGDPGSSTCACQRKFDDKVCAPALSASDPDSACEVCCLTNGYLGEEFIGIGTPECDCS